MMKRAVFLDRDGTLNEEKEYLSDPDRLVLFPGVGPALRQLRDAGFRLFIVTNQSGIGRGYYTLNDMHRVNERLQAILAREGVAFDHIYFAPEAPDQPSRGRKPSPEFLRDARDEFGVVLERSYMVGDKRLDAEAGVNAGATGVWLRIPGGRYAEPGRVDKAENIKEFLSLLDFAEFLREFDGRNGTGTAPRRPGHGAG